MRRMTPASFLERRRRTAARLALYGSLVLVTGAAALLIAWMGRPLRMRAHERDLIEIDFPSLPEVRLLADYVRIDTSEATGDELAGARFLAGKLEEAGIPARVEVIGGRHANLYALLEGADPRPLVLHNHIDVESADPAEWIHPPFSAQIELPFIYGRGTFDMKSVAVAQLMAMIDLKKSGRPLRRSVLFLATSSEERGSRLGVRWILRRHPELVRSFWAVLTEGGIVEARARDDIKYWGIEVVQKRFADLVVCSGSREQLEDLRRTLVERGYTDTDLKVLPEVRSLLEVYAPTRDRGDYRALLEDPDATVADVRTFRQLPNYLKSMFRNEAVPFDIEEAPGGGYQMMIKIHLLPGEKLEEVIGGLVPPWMTWGMPVAFDMPPSALRGSPLDHPVFQEIQEAIGERYPGAPSGPWFLPWSATDSRFFRAAGVPSYGFSPFVIMNTETLRVDKANERFSLPSFVQGVELYQDVVRRLVQ